MLNLWSKNLLLKKLDPYKKNQVLFNNSMPNTYSINIKKGIYEIVVIGAGGGGCGNGAKGSSNSGCSGAAGGGYRGKISLPQGTLNLLIGKGGTKTGGGDYQGDRANTGGTTSLKFNGTNIVTCGGGTGGRAWFRGKASTGTGGSVTTGSYIVQTYQSVTGSNGQGGGGGALYTCPCPISGYNYGAGGNGQGLGSGYNWSGTTDGQNGYIKISYYGLKS